jgi:hypothetical protein
MERDEERVEEERYKSMERQRYAQLMIIEQEIVWEGG